MIVYTALMEQKGVQISSMSWDEYSNAAIKQAGEMWDSLVEADLVIGGAVYSGVSFR